MTAKIERRSSYKLAYETDKVRLEIEDGLAMVTKKHGSPAPPFALTTPAVGDGMSGGPFRVVLADPPWRYDDKLRMSGVARSSDDQYDTMSVAEICGLSQRLDVSSHSEPGKSVHFIGSNQVADEALLFLWVTSGMLLDLSGVAVCKAWGFAPKQLATWVKTKGDWMPHAEFVTEAAPAGELLPQAEYDALTSDLQAEGLQFGMGRIFRGVTEHVIVGTKGKYSSLIKSHSERNAFFAPRAEHSTKPDCVQEAIERLIDGPYLEMFARRQRAGWSAWGHEAPPKEKE